MCKALLDYHHYRDAVDAARLNGTSLLEEYIKLGGRIVEGAKEKIADLPKAFAIYDDEVKELEVKESEPKEEEPKVEKNMKHKKERKFKVKVKKGKK